MSSPSEATTSTRNISLTEEEEEAAAATPTPALQSTKSLPASFPPRVTPNNQQASSNKFAYSPSGDITPNNQQASSSNVTVPPPGENTLNERIEFINNSVGVVLTKYEDEKEELKAEKKLLSDRVDARDEKIENLEATIDSKTEEVRKKNAALAQKEKHNMRDKSMHKQIRDKMNEEISDHKQDLTAARAEIQKTKHELDDAEKKYIKLEQEATAYKMSTETQLLTKQEGIEQLKGEIVVCKLGLAFAKEDISDKDTANKNLRTQHESLRQESTDQIKLLEQVVEQEKAYKENAINEKNVSDGKYTKLVQEAAECSTKTNTQLTTMRADIAQLKGTIVSLKEESVTKKTEYEDLKVRYEEREREVEQAKADKMKAIQERDVSDGKYTKLVQEAAECSRNLEFAKDDLSDKETANRKLQTDIRKLRNDNAKIQGEITVVMNAHADKKKLTTEIEELWDKIKSEKEKYNKAVASHKKELAKKDAELATGNEELTTKNKELVEQLGLEKEELKEVKQEHIEQRWGVMNDHERNVDANEIDDYEENLAREREEFARKKVELVEEQEKVARKKDELVGDQEEIAQKEVKLARRKERRTNTVEIPDNNDEEDSTFPVVVIKMGPHNQYRKGKCDGCEQKFCAGPTSDKCGKVTFMYGCTGGCDNNPVESEKSWRKHVQGHSTVKGCRPYAEKYPLHIAFYKRVLCSRWKIYRPNFGLKKVEDLRPQNDQKDSAKEWQKKLKKDADEYPRGYGY